MPVGHGHVPQVRADVFDLYRHRPDFLLHDTTGLHNDSSLGLGATNRTGEEDWLATMMTRSDFCYAPSGQSEGDSDRYLPALLYGCVPVFAWSDEEGPYSDLIDWDQISIRVDPSGLASAVDAVSDETLAIMRKAMQGVWHRMLFAEAADGHDGPSLTQLMLNRSIEASDSSAHTSTRQYPPDGLQTFFDVLEARMREGGRASSAPTAQPRELGPLVIGLNAPDVSQQGHQPGASTASVNTSSASTNPWTVVEETISPGTPIAVGTQVMRNQATGEMLQVAHSVGGKTLRLQLLSPATGKVRDVLVPLTDAAAIRDTTASHSASSILVPFANRVANGTYTFYGQTHHLPRNECGELRCNALHGFLYNRTMSPGVWQTYAAGAGYGVNLTLAYQFDGTDTPGWPFQADVRITYSLESSSGAVDAHTKLNIHVHAINTMVDAPLPWTASWHPYFLVSDVSKARIEFDSKHNGAWQHLINGPGAPRNGDLIPTGKTEAWAKFDGATPLGGTPTEPTYMDDEFKTILKGGGDISQRIHDGNETTVLTGKDSVFGTWQVFSGAKEGWGWDAIALEPMSGLADAFNNGDGLTVLNPGEAFCGSFEVSLE